MAKYAVVVALGLILLMLPLFLTGVVAPSGTGVLSNVQQVPGGDVLKDSNDMFMVNPGGTYRVIITNIENSIVSPTTVYIKGKYQSGVSWIIVLTDQVIASGTITSSTFVLGPPDLDSSLVGCTIVVAYESEGHLAAEFIGSNNPGHLKTYDGAGQPIPCEGVSVPEFPAPEFPLGLDAIIPLCLLAAYAIIRKKKQ